jgi:hypothetical protein
LLKISIIDSRTHRRLVLEGKLVGPWADELRPAWEMAKVELGGRELVVEVKNLIAINQAGENALLELMREGVKVRGCGVFPRQILKELTRRVKRKDKERQ